jgi:DNA-directed RNA polymerase sigma subunit (sigma70/sigma32)
MEVGNTQSQFVQSMQLSPAQLSEIEAWAKKHPKEANAAGAAILVAGMAAYTEQQLDQLKGISNEAKALEQAAFKIQNDPNLSAPKRAALEAKVTGQVTQLAAKARSIQSNLTGVAEAAEYLQQRLSSSMH